MDVSEMVEITLASLAAGEAGERWNYTLPKIVENIRDLNTEPEAKRVINLKITFIPAENREFVTANVEVTTNVAHIKPHSMLMFIRRSEDGRLVLTGKNPQYEMMQEQIDHTKVAGEIKPPKGKAGNV